MRAAAVLTVTAAGAVALALSLPPARLDTATGQGDGTVPGALHVHTNRSDGRSSPDVVATAAARAGLGFVIFTDHGDGMRAPDPPVYRSGVLCLDGVEISTAGGHYIAIGMAPSPYPLAGEPRTVVEDVRRLGGFGIVAHPDSTRPELQWRDWDLPIDAMEVVNLDSSWRRHVDAPGWRPKARLLRALLTYPFRAEESMATLVAAAHTAAGRYRTLLPNRRVVAVAGVDAHAKLELRGADPGDYRFSLPFPGYEPLLRTLSVHVRPSHPLGGNASVDAQAILEGLRAGHVYSAVRGLASPSEFTFTAVRQGTAAAAGGDEIPPGDRVTIEVRSNAPPTFTTRIWQDGRVLAAGNTGERGGSLSLEAPGAGVYQAEILATDRPDEPPWIIGNPIYLRDLQPTDLPADRPPAETQGLHDLGLWQAEAEATSHANVRREAGAPDDVVLFEFRLGGGVPSNQFAAAVIRTPEGVAPYERVRLTMRSDRPMRLSFQARIAVDDTRDDRWHYSVFSDTVERPVLVRFADLMPIGPTTTPRPNLERVHSLLFVVELTNTRPGTTGRVWLGNVALER